MDVDGQTDPISAQTPTSTSVVLEQCTRRGTWKSAENYLAAGRHGSIRDGSHHARTCPVHHRHCSAGLVHRIAQVLTPGRSCPPSDLRHTRCRSTHTDGGRDREQSVPESTNTCCWAPVPGLRESSCPRTRSRSSPPTTRARPPGCPSCPTGAQTWCSRPPDRAPPPPVGTCSSSTPLRSMSTASRHGARPRKPGQPPWPTPPRRRWSSATKRHTGH